MTTDKELYDLVFERDYLAELDPAARRLALRSLVTEIVDPVHVAGVVAALADEVDGFGPLSPLMRDDDVTDVLVNGPREVWVERRGRLERTLVKWESEEDLRAFIDRLLGPTGARADASNPLADARLPDGGRMHVALPPLAPHGPLVSIRRWPRMRLSLDDLAVRGLLTADQAHDLRGAVADRRTICVSGATGTGKTTLLNALLGCVGHDERVVTIEETPELRPACTHVVSLVARASNVEGRGEIDLASLVRAALRMRPDRIIVGEVRGREAHAAIAALSTGHEGSMTTLHAGSAADAVDRMTMLALEASTAGHDVVRKRVGAAFDLVVHLARRDGDRRAVEIMEVA